MLRALPSALIRVLEVAARVACGLVIAGVLTYLVLLLCETFPLALGGEAFIWSVDNLPWGVGLCAVVGVAGAVVTDRAFIRHRLSSQAG